VVLVAIGLLEEKMFAGGIGTMEILIILFIVLIIFGAGKLPKLGEGLGKGIRSFKKEIKGIQDRDNKRFEEKNPTASHT
jgi:sec-independent protein translocase protein TatA